MNQKTQNIDRSTDEGKKFSIFTHISFNLIGIVLYCVASPLNTYYFYFYESVIGLDPLWIAAAFTVYSIWNAINDPLMGYLADKPRKWTKRWGRRFPWIMTAGLPLIVISVLVWTPPVGAGQNVVFIYFIGILLLFETLFTMVGAPTDALFIEKFKTDADRRKNATVSVFTQFVAVLLGTMLPGLILGSETDDPSNYRLMGLAMGIPALIFLLLAIPGIREKREAIDGALEVLEHKERTPFFKSFWMAIKSKNFTVFSIVALASGTAFGIVVTGLIYWLEYFLEVSTEFVWIFILAYFIAGVIAAPLWMLVIKKIGLKKSFVIDMFWLAITFFLMLLVKNITAAFILIALMGTIQGGGVICLKSLLGDVTDELTVRTGKPNQGFYSGIYAFILRLGSLVPPIIIALTLDLTQFDKNNVTDAAKDGIISFMSWIPGGIVLIGTILFLFIYDLTASKTDAIKKQLREMNL